MNFGDLDKYFDKQLEDYSKRTYEEPETTDLEPSDEQIEKFNKKYNKGE